MLNIQINTRTSGKFRHETVNNRPHIVAVAMPIRGDITMNGIFYPDAEVTNSFMQLDLIPAPLGHPVVNGQKTTVRHPAAMNAHNIGGFLHKPRKKGKRVFVDFFLDEVVANQSEEGKAVLAKIEAGERIGLSTGLSIQEIVNKSGTDDFGKAFTREGHGFGFDHVAILPNEQAAGEHAGTELILNEGQDDEILVTNLLVNELSLDEIRRALEDLISTGARDEFAWVREIFPDSKQFIFSRDGGTDRMFFKQSFAVSEDDEVTLVDDRAEVEQVSADQQFTPITNTEAPTVDLDKLILAIVTNSAFGFAATDIPRLTAMSEGELVTALVPPSVTTEAARELLTNSGHSFDGYDEYVTNKDDFAAFKVARDERVKTLVAEIVTNTEFTEEQLTGKPEAELIVLSGMYKKATPVAEGVTVVNNQSQNAAKTGNDYGW